MLDEGKLAAKPAACTKGSAARGSSVAALFVAAPAGAGAFWAAAETYWAPPAGVAAAVAMAAGVTAVGV